MKIEELKQVKCSKCGNIVQANKIAYCKCRHYGIVYVKGASKN
jgi:hypothetical protein